MDSEVTDWLETEHKYDVDPDFVIPELAGLAAGLSVTEPAVQHLAASYYDTPDFGLAAAGITLRRRTGGADAGWHLKLPVAPGSRRELRAPLGPGAEDVPDSLAAQVTTWTGGQPLRVIAVLETTRTVRRITGPAGQDLAEVADDLVAARRAAAPGRDSTSFTWREIEVELISGTPAILAAAGTRLRAAGARPSPSASKLSRLLASDPDPAGSPSA
jgi:inorganic triphosphatase YgiF